MAWYSSWYGSADEFQRLVHHVFLPPKLPQQADEEDCETHLAEATLMALLNLKALCRPDPPPESLENVVHLLQGIDAINSMPGGALNESCLQQRLTQLAVGRTVAINVRRQNAAVLVTRRPNELVFEVFELSPLAAQVVQTEGRLTRTFPGQAVAVPVNCLDVPDFVNMVASTLSTMSRQPTPGMQPQSLKSGVLHDETRDTADPAMVTDLFMGVLSGFGSPTSVSSISKNTRDEVLWEDAKLPWRRSPMWLLIRVSMQLVVSRASDGPHVLYKEIMVFIMSHILKSAQDYGLSPDLMYCMAAKIDRRLQKLSSTGPGVLPHRVMVKIDDILQQSKKFLDETWRSCQKTDSRDLQLSTLPTLDFEKDTLVELPALDEHIKAMHKRPRGNTPVFFTPFSLPINLNSGCLPSLADSRFSGSCAAANLGHFERWVAQHIDDWVAANDRDNACQRLHELMVQYRKLAEVHYIGNPEAISMMVLTMFELWVACDKAALRQCPLLGKYDPGITIGILQSLLLPLAGQMKRLSDLEDHMEKRRQQSTRRADLLFASHNSECFANQYFDTSNSHQELLSEIETEAKKTRHAKLEEFKMLKAKHDELHALHNATDHEFITTVIDSRCDPPKTDQVCLQTCKNCASLRERKKLTIQPHEWPLPCDPSQAKTVVFELRIPPWFGHWRDARLVLLQDVLKGKRKKVRPQTKYLLSAQDPHLTRKHSNRKGKPRIDLMSVTKPFVKTHYKDTDLLGLCESRLCVANGLTYKYYDAKNDEYPGDFKFNDEVSKACTYTMPCKALQRFLMRPASAPDGPGPNAVIGSQDACPKNMTLEEYKEFGTLPLGHRIQWANILLQLAMPSLDFKKPETTLLLLQCAYQAGPRLAGASQPTALRSSHDFFSREENAASLLKHLTTALQRVKDNWESSQALFTFAALATRALSLSPSSSVQAECVRFLSSVRDIAMGWVNSLRDKAHAAVEHKDRTTFTAKSVEVALICTSTFDIDDEHLTAVLAGVSNASILMQCCIAIEEGHHALASDKEPLLALLDMRRKRLLCRAYRFLAQNHCALDDAIKKAWSAYEPGSPWRPASDTIDHWVTTDMCTTAQAVSISVHYNLLSGELLANGVPLDQPPEKYRAHPQYSTLFGKAVVEVMPSATPGFDFSTKREFGGFSVQLGMSDSGLIVRATRDGATYETLPKRLFGEVYPTSFVDDYIHWLDVATNAVQFVPIHEPWNLSSPEVWTLSSLQPTWKLSRCESSVVSIDSLTSRTLSDVLDPLAKRTRIHNIWRPSGDVKKLMVSIPTLNLNFTLAQGSELLESIEFRSMVVDADQSLGTLVGLRSKIVLKHSTTDERKVLVPESEVVTYQRGNKHVSVTIEQRSIQRVHSLDVDPTLGRLLDNGELGCKLFLAYLHALTSFCLVDPLTKKTGTEQALSILRSAAVRSFDQLSQANIDLLAKIAALPPGRCYYPAHLQVMQTVKWDNSIGFLSQHGHFTAAVQALFQQARHSLIFFPDAQLSFPPLEGSEEHLLRRDNIRSATFRVSGFGAEDHITRKDQTYKARDRDSTSALTKRAFTMSRLIFRDDIKQCSPTFDVESLWKSMCKLDTIHGLDSPMELSSLKYDAGLLADGYKYVLQHLPPLHRNLSISTDPQQHKFSVAMWLSTVASDPDADLSVLQSIAILVRFKLGYYVLEDYAIQVDSFKLKGGDTFSRDGLWPHIEAFTHESRPYLQAVEINGSHYHIPPDESKWDVARQGAIATLVDVLSTQWPTDDPANPDVLSPYINVDKAMPGIISVFKIWYNNRELHQYLKDFQRTISHLPCEPIEFVELTMRAPETRPGAPGCVTEHGMFLLPAPELPEACPDVELTLDCPAQQQKLGEKPRLNAVVERLERVAGRSKYHTQYAADLRASLDALVSRGNDGHPSVNVATEELLSHLTSCTEHVRKVYGLLETAVYSQTNASYPRFKDQRPRISPTFFLRQLSRSRWHHLSEGWKKCIVQYALALAAMQRAERLTKLTEKQDIINELRNPGHKNWNPADHPETLLMEVESGFLVRDVQAQVAEQMRNPPDGNNAVMQLNMGEGKSSVITPMVIAALANGEQLPRVVVAKPQSKQMLQMLISKLGGLLDRRVYFMPISRSLKFDIEAARIISDMLHDCMSSGGVLLVQPEHILSFQLMAIECLILGKHDVGQQLMSTQHFLEDKSRDIVDESDENFNVRFELIYTMGTQHPIELSPDRWLLLQELLDVVREVAPRIAKDLPFSLECQPAVPGGFPRIRALRPNGANLLKVLLADHIYHNGLGSLQVSRQPDEIRKAVCSYITKAELSKEEVSAVEESAFWNEATKQPLLLLRGIMACGVLEFVLRQKRWRVNYGLASRTPPTQLAVPYRAKDSPSPRSDFSHPDVAIILTSLSYYYGGLSDDDLFVAMGHLMEADQSEVEYQAWVRDANGLPAAFKQLQGINLKDRPLCTSEIFPALRFGKSVIDYFLAHIVFSKQMKEFTCKLTGSGWDIGKRKSRPVTGFSGTNDSRCLLPVDMHHFDHPAQKHTNASVLEHILRPDNGVELMDSVAQDNSDAEHLLATVLRLSPPVQVILDVGALITELTNIQVAKEWLKHDATKEAAVFVNDDDELCVVDRDDRVDLLRDSSFSTRLDACLVYLDEAHTRGIDLRLPSNYRAAVTLGANLTKDRLVQACMRMRKLGKGQTVVFCISQEIQVKIEEIKQTTRDPAPVASSAITLEDVILWSMSETDVDLRRSMSSWAEQGRRFVRQDKLWQQLQQDWRTLPAKEYAKKAKRFLEKEAQSLEDRFGPRQDQSQLSNLANAPDPDLRRISERLAQFDQLQYNASTLQEEQERERELAPEIEQERQVQKVPGEPPASHSLHEDVRKFALAGEFIKDSKAYMPAFQALQDSSAASDFGVWQLAGRRQLLVTADFARTVEPSRSSSYVSDTFQRPVQWLLTSRAKETHTVDRIIIISPYEANKLYKDMQKSNAAALHVFKPRCNSGYAALDELDFHTVTAQTGPCTVPRGLAMQLALFSGQLYISSFGDYKEICSFLGLSPQAVTQEMSEQGWEVAADGFILSDEQGRSGGGAMPSISPVGFFKILMSKIRRNGDGIAKTHMGSLLEGKLFKESDFEQ